MPTTRYTPNTDSATDTILLSWKLFAPNPLLCSVCAGALENRRRRELDSLPIGVVLLHRSDVVQTVRLHELQA